NRDRSRRGVPIAIDIENDLVLGHAEPRPGGVDDALIGLVRNQKVELGGIQACYIERSPQAVLHAANRDLEQLLAAHPDVMTSFIDGLVTGGTERPSRRHL